MKNFFLITTLFFTTYLCAQEQTATTSETLPIVNDFDAVNGFQIGIKRGLIQNTKSSHDHESIWVSKDSDYELMYGFSFSWTKNYDHEIGFRGALNLDTYEGLPTHSHNVWGYLEANATYLINQHFIPYLGLNSSRNWGYQIGITGQIVNQLSYQIVYQVLNFEENSSPDGYDNVESELQFRSILIGLIYTF